MVACPNEYGLYEHMVELKFPKHMYKMNGGYYESKTSCFVDPCIKDEILELWGLDVVTMGSCCGHGQLAGGIINVLEKDAETMESLGYIKLPKKEGLWEFTYYPKSKHVSK